MPFFVHALLHVCLFISLPFRLSPTPVFYFHPHTQIMQTVMYAQLVLTETSRKRVVYTSPVDTLI